jgi:hypothetical protein
MSCHGQCFRFSVNVFLDEPSDGGSVHRDRVALETVRVIYTRFIGVRVISNVMNNQCLVW